MRITGGSACGIPLAVPQYGKIRPATDFLRQSIFNRLAEGLHDRRVLDGFAGTGAYGLEALSRGASHCIFVEKNRSFISNLQGNIERVCKSCGRSPRQCARIVCASIFAMKFPQDISVDYIFLDPPFLLWDTDADALFTMLNCLGNRFRKSLLVLEFPSQLIWPIKQKWEPQYPLSVVRKTDDPKINVFQWRG